MAPPSKPAAQSLSSLARVLAAGIMRGQDVEAWVKHHAASFAKPSLDGLAEMDTSDQQARVDSFSAWYDRIGDLGRTLSQLLERAEGVASRSPESAVDILSGAETLATLHPVRSNLALVKLRKGRLLLELESFDEAAERFEEAAHI